MKYKKGTFVIVPNKERLRSKPTEYQTIFFWLCAYSNENGTCFPSRTKLANDCGLTDRTIDKYVEKLVSDGLIEKKRRKNKGTNEYTSNLYQILFYNGAVKRKTQLSERNDPTSGERNIPITVSNSNYNNLTSSPLKKEDKKSFSFEEEMDKLKNSAWKPKKIIYFYFLKKNFKFENQIQFDAEYQRNLRPAISLQGYNSTQVEQTIDYLEQKGLEWRLETIGRNISNVVNKI